MHFFGINDTIDYMKKLKNLKHIFSITLISLLVTFGSIYMIPDNLKDELNGIFIYRTSSVTNGHAWQDYIYKHTLKASSSDIVIIKIDEKTLNSIQNNPNDLKNLTLTKRTYSDLVKNLEKA